MTGGERSHPYLEIFERADSLWDWRLVGGNGEIVCSSFQGYTSETDAKRAIERTRELIGLATEIRMA